MAGSKSSFSNTSVSDTLRAAMMAPLVAIVFIVGLLLLAVAWEALVLLLLALTSPEQLTSPGRILLACVFRTI